MIDVNLMAVGRGEFQLDPTTPRKIVEGLETWSMICVTPGRILNPSADEVIAASRWSGILRERSEDATRIAGPSIAAWLGDDDDKGPYVTETVDGSSGAQAMIQDLFAPSANVNGLYLGDYSSLPTTTLWVALHTPQVETPRGFLNRMHDLFGWVYRVRPDLVVDVGEEFADIFRDGEVLITADAEWALDKRIIRGDISLRSTDEDFATEVYVTSGAYDGSAVGLTAINNARGDSGGALVRHHSGGDVNSDSAAADLAARLLLTEYATKNFVDVEIDSSDPLALIEPGDTVLLWNERAGVVDLANEYDGPHGPIYPQAFRVQGMSVPLLPDNGLYAIQNSDLACVDLSDYAVPEDGRTTLTVGARWPLYEELFLGRGLL